MIAGAITSTEHGVTYWFKELDGEHSFKVEDGIQARVSEWKTDLYRKPQIRIEIDGIHCSPKPGWGIRPTNPVTVEYKDEKGKKQTLVLQ